MRSLATITIDHIGPIGGVVAAKVELTLRVHHEQILLVAERRPLETRVPGG